MRTQTIKGKSYNLPSSLTPFQLDMYVHLIDWKRDNITAEKGIYKHKGKEIEYDAILPKRMRYSYKHIYKPIIPTLQKLQYKPHSLFNHIVSSQAANINLFLPILIHLKVNDIFGTIKADFKQLAKTELNNGFQLEYWDQLTNEGLLGDHSTYSGTDSDIAIAYYNKRDELCLWLIEHKLTESAFTECGAYKSRGNKNKQNCSKSFSDILAQKDLCYYHSVRNFNYWKLTDNHQSFYSNHLQYPNCPFKKGMNQLWRNQLLGLALESQGKFKEVYFSVVIHPDNHQLDKSLAEYKNLINNNPKFSSFTSRDVIHAATKMADPVLDAWIDWYKTLYKN